MTIAFPSSVKAMASEEASWIGAFVDGEGTVDQDHQGYPRIRTVNTEPELLSVLLRVTGVGTVYYKRPMASSTKPAFEWAVHRINDVLDLLNQIAPYSIKAQRALERRDRR